MLFDIFDNKTIIKGKLLALDPIHIGASAKNTLNPTDVDNNVLKDSTGRAVIPGSSLKGVVRSYFESVMRAIYGEKGACDVLDNRNCCTSSIEKELKAEKNLRRKAETAYSNSCKACKFFGGKEIAGKLQFKDSFLIGNPVYEYRDGVGIDRVTGAAKNGAKYDFEIIPKGSEFDFCLIAENLDDGQEKLLTLVIEQLKSGEISVGGKTTRGLGRIKLLDEVIERTTADDLKKRLGL